VQITFDTTTITDDEVRGIFALLDTVCPKAFDPGPFDASEVTRAVEEKLADKGWVAGPSETVVKLAEETVEDHTAPTTDANGLPWHPDIHSGTKALNADGTWRTKRGVDKALVAEVEAELRATLDMDAADGVAVAEVLAGPTMTNAEEVAERMPPSPPAPPAPEAPTAPLAPVVTESAPADTVAPTPSAPVAPSSSTSPFVALMKRVTTAQGAGKLTAQRVKELLESLDKKSIMDLRTDTDALDAFAVLLDGEGV
jgi:hypothetical protein